VGDAHEEIENHHQNKKPHGQRPRPRPGLRQGKNGSSHKAKQKHTQKKKKKKKKKKKETMNQQKKEENLMPDHSLHQMMHVAQPTRVRNGMDWDEKGILKWNGRG